MISPTPTSASILFHARSGPLSNAAALKRNVEISAQRDLVTANLRTQVNQGVQGAQDATRGHDAVLQHDVVVHTENVAGGTGRAVRIDTFA